MAACKSVILLLFAVFATVLASSEVKAKREVILGAIPSIHHYATPLVHYGAHPSIHYTAAHPSIHYTAAHAAIPYHTHSITYDDGKYFPGKYEKPTFYNALPHMFTV